MLIPFYYSFRNEHLTLFERNTLQTAKVLALDYRTRDFSELENALLKYSALKGGSIYDASGNLVKKFGIDPKVGPAAFENATLINGQFYIKDKNHIYTLWNQQDLQLPFEVVAVLDNTQLKIILSQFIETYWNEAIFMLLIVTLASLSISYILLIKPIRRAYQFLQLSGEQVSDQMPHLAISAKNELDFIFKMMNLTFSQLQLTFKSLEQQTLTLNTMNDTLEQQVEERTQQLAQSNKELAAMALFPEQNTNPVLRATADGSILYANKACHFLFQFWNCELTRKLPPYWIETLQAILKSNREKQIEVLADEKVFLLNLVPIPADNYVNIYGDDISDRKRIEQENRFLQSHNSVTRLCNKHFFKLLLEERQKQSISFGLFFLQINDYMAINQNLGHSIGDKFLAHIADKLQRNISKEDLLGHFSQNIFAFATYNFFNIEKLDSLAFQFVSLFSQPFFVESYTLHTSINIGIALYPTDHTDIETLFQYADMALLQAHSAGVNTAQFYTQDINQQLSKNHQLYQDLHRAVVEKQLSLVYQPQLSLHTNKLIGAETLIRWHHPEKGLIPPDEFIAILENSSLIFLITDWLFQTAAKLHQELKKDGIGEFRFSVNLTAKQLNQDDLLTILERVVEQYSINATFIEIEVTERVSLTDPDKYIDILKSIRSLGFKIAIDDFGSDYSSLKYLQKLPIDKIKIDKSFIEDMHKHNDNQKIVTAIIHLSKELDLQTLAEGVETIEQAALLKHLGCDEIQGYLISKPLDEAKFIEFCQQNLFKFSDQNFEN